MPDQLQKLEALLKGKNQFTAKGETVSRLHNVAGASLQSRGSKMPFIVERMISVVMSSQ